MAQAPTKSGRLSEIARHVVLPEGIVSTGWPSARDKCHELGIAFDSWQDDAGRAILAKRADGLYAATVGGVVISIPRQVGKTFLLGAIVFALCLLFPGLTVIWTAHRLRTAGETFRSMQSMARRKTIKPHVAKVVLGSGDEEIVFRNGSRILFGARERGFGRGFSGVDVLVFDEAQILTESAIDDMVPATNQAPNPLVLMTGTPPKPTDPSEVFARKRQEALTGETNDSLYIEFSADPGASPEDRAQWRIANPSHPKRTPVEAMLRMKRNLGAESFLREGLGIWDSDDNGSAIPSASWSDCFEPGEMATAPVFGLDVSPNHSWSAIAAAGRRADGDLHVEITTTDDGRVVDHREGTDWVLPRLIDMCTRWDDLTINIAAGSGAEALKPDIEALGITVNVIPAAKVPAACGFMYDKATTGGIKHLGQEPLTAAVRASRKHQEDGETAWKFGRRKSSGDITPLYAATLAVWALVDVDDDRGEVSVYGFNDLDACDGCGKRPHEDPDGDHDYLCEDCRDKGN